MKPKILDTPFKFYLILIIVLGLALPITSQALANLEPFPERGEQILSSLTIIETKLTASDAEDFDQFGIAVAVSGDTAVVGSYEDGAGSQYGAAYIFERNQPEIGQWVEVRKLTAPEGANYNYFGFSVAISGDIIVVGAYGEDSFSYRPGGAYVYQRNQGGPDQWGLVKKLTASDVDSFDQFGYSVAISGDIIVVGAYTEDGLGSVRGAAYIFERNKGGLDNWGEVTKVTASDAEDEDYFGQSVSISGETVVVGANMEDGSGIGRGAAYVFDRDLGGANNWGEVAKLTASDTEDYDYFGISVGINLDTVVVGAYTEDGVGDRRGAAYVYERNQGSPDGWGEVIKLTASDSEDSDKFGQSVAITDGLISIGAPGCGATYIFGRIQGNPDNWQEVTKLVSSDVADGAWIGYAVSISGDTVISGSPGNYGEGEERGAAYVFELQHQHNVYLPMLVRNY